MVVMKLTLERSEEVMLKASAMIHIDWPVRALGQEEFVAEHGHELGLVRDDRKGGVGGPARLGRATRHDHAADHQDGADEEEDDAAQVQPGEGHVDRADLERHGEVAEGGEPDRDDAEERP